MCQSLSVVLDDCIALTSNIAANTQIYEIRRFLYKDARQPLGKWLTEGLFPVINCAMIRIKLLFAVSFISNFAVGQTNYHGFASDHYETMFGLVKKEIYIVYNRDYCYINIGGVRSVDFPIGMYRTDTAGNESFISGDDEISLMRNYSVSVTRTKNGNTVKIMDRQGMTLSFDHAQVYNADNEVTEYLERKKVEQHTPIMVGGK